jgi:hypothetical protein
VYGFKENLLNFPDINIERLYNEKFATLDVAHVMRVLYDPNGNDNRDQKWNKSIASVV